MDVERRVQLRRSRLLGTTVDRKLVDDLASLRFMDTGRPILFLGQPGCGKTHLAVAIATLAVEAGFRGYFTNAEEMVANIAQANREGTLTSKLKTYTAPSVLVIDDVGLLPMDRAAASATTRAPSPHHRQHRPDQTTTELTSPTGKDTNPANATFVDHRTRLSLIANSPAVERETVGNISFSRRLSPAVHDVPLTTRVLLMPSSIRSSKRSVHSQQAPPDARPDHFCG